LKNGSFGYIASDFACPYGQHVLGMFPEALRPEEERGLFHRKVAVKGCIIPQQTYTSFMMGVVGDVRNTTAESEPPLLVYLPMAQYPSGAMTLVVRTPDPAPAIRQAVMEVDPEMPVAMMRKLEDVVTGSIAGRRFQVLLLASFASMALLLACIGVYGVVSFSVAQKRNEFGIRIALGANRRDILTLVLRDGLKPVLVGLGATDEVASRCERT
jgi:hypothetical protein